MFGLITQELLELLKFDCKLSFQFSRYFKKSKFFCIILVTFSSYQSRYDWHLKKKKIWIAEIWFQVKF